MASTYNHPGVYVEEIPSFPPSVAQVATAIPAFIGYTPVGEMAPVRISSLVEYESIFGKREEIFSVKLNVETEGITIEDPPKEPATFFKMYYAMQMYFANGGGPCYIASVGKDEGKASYDDMKAGLAAIALEDEPTLLVFPDATLLDEEEFFKLYTDALAQCNDLGDRFLIADMYAAEKEDDDTVKTFREKIGSNYLKYAAAYYPYLETSINFSYDENKITFKGHDDSDADYVMNNADAGEGKSLFRDNNKLYHDIKNAIAKLSLVLPPSSAMAGVYARTDADRGVWKAPANTSLNFVKKVTRVVDDAMQDGLNVNVYGKSINVIRKFTGRGILVWGARTLDGNSNEWRYISVRRFFNMVEESTKKASAQFVFEPNDANTWVKVKSMLENFLILQWRAGALAGAKPEHAFYVKVGLGQTMTVEDILEGRLIIEIGMAVVRPAEFIILRFSHKMQES